MQANAAGLVQQYVNFCIVHKHGTSNNIVEESADNKQITALH